MKGSKVYTKGGDKGWTSLVGGIRIPKGDLRIESYGTVDELNAFIGLLGVSVEGKEDKDFLLYVQRKLFSIGAYLATDTKQVGVVECGVREEDVRRVEGEIDRVEGGLPVMRFFVLSGGNEGASLAHVCRTVCRRAERDICRLAEEVPVDGVLLAFVNRLSDYFFVLARKESLNKGGSEIVWKG
ncbi:MAG: cob(I)yrinic acid a,c-diamide adenosyltransferase [Tannerellaceae bacterium]|jgi:cob(I)alamin adenosyltransferase|nr:cob(I)yrinic acid a,c-diamide adenosyltransferase [Tannerellaceae bacterium]